MGTEFDLKTFKEDDYEEGETPDSDEQLCFVQILGKV
jgi:hypothetical protein